MCRKRITRTLLTLAALLAAACSRFDDMTLFDFPVVEVGEALPSSISLESREMLSSPGTHYIHDSLIITRNFNGEYLFSVAKVGSDDPGVQFCPRGRSNLEPLNSLPSFDVENDESGLKVDFISYFPFRFFRWNVTESLLTQKTSYDYVCDIHSDTTSTFYPTSFFVISDNRICFLESGQNPYYSWPTSAPSYEIYSLQTGQKIKTIRPYNLPKMPRRENEAFPSQLYYSSFEAIRPDRRCLVSAMLYVPQLNILDLDTEKMTGYRPSGAKGLNPDKMRFHFLDIACNQERIYALYSGNKPKNGMPVGNVTLKVCDWEGTPLCSYDVGTKSRIFIDETTLYLTDIYQTTLYQVPLADIR